MSNHNVRNTKHDASSYDCSCYEREIWDCNVLFNAFIRTRRHISNKDVMQRYEMNWLNEICTASKKIENGSYEFEKPINFVGHERGKTRLITSEKIKDKVVKHALCDNVLVPSMRKYLIYDNGASLEGKGVNFTRKRLEAHLRRFYRKHETNEGYILLTDFSKYFDNILHDTLLEMFEKHIDDECATKLLRKAIKLSEIDASYMSDEEYANYRNEIFNSLDYNKIDSTLLNGTKYMRKHLNIGDQIAQISGVSYTMPIDNYIKIVKGVKYYGRYNDDAYIIDSDKNRLKELLNDICVIAEKIGIHMNTKKSKIVKLSDYWKFLQIKYSLTSTGRIIKKIDPKKITIMRRKMKKIAGNISKKEFENWYKSWFNANYKIMSKKQRENLNLLRDELIRDKYTNCELKL